MAVRPGSAALIVLTAIVAAGLTCIPTAIDGDDVTLAHYGLIEGLAVGSLWACLCGPALVCGTGFVEYDLRLREARFLAGDALRQRSLVQLATLLFGVVIIWIFLAALSLLAGLSDFAIRALLGVPHRLIDLDASASLLKSATGLAMALALTVVTWLLVTAARSATRSLLLIAVAAGSWLALLITTRGVESREFLALHPIAWLWSLGQPARSSALTLDMSPLILGGCAAVWVALLGILAVRGMSRT